MNKTILYRATTWRRKGKFFPEELFAKVCFRRRDILIFLPAKIMLSVLAELPLIKVSTPRYLTNGTPVILCCVESILKKNCKSGLWSCVHIYVIEHVSITDSEKPCISLYSDHTSNIYGLVGEIKTIQPSISVFFFWREGGGWGGPRVRHRRTNMKLISVLLRRTQ